MKEIPIVGLRFGRVVVLRKTEQRRGGHRVMACRCDCGKDFTALSCNIRRGDTSSCGCYNSEVTARRNRKHGMSGTPEWWAWWSMISRCTIPAVDNYKDYGGRGIKVCDKWINSFQEFFNDMGEKPSLLHSLDRIDVNGNYEPDNCRWATAEQQANNTRRNVILEFRGSKMTLTQFCRAYGIENKRHTVKRHYFKRGVSLEDVLNSFSK